MLFFALCQSHADELSSSTQACSLATAEFIFIALLAALKGLEMG